MMNWLFWIILATYMATALVWAMPDVIGRHKKPKATPKSQAKTYGHPHAPVPYLQSKLLDPPEGFFWEIRVEADDEGIPFLYLSLVGSLNGKPVGETAINLFKQGDVPYATIYRNSGMNDDYIFKTSLINPLLKWADDQVTKHAVPPSIDGGEYAFKMRNQ